jgi:hypothetical protein
MGLKWTIHQNIVASNEIGYGVGTQVTEKREH